MVGKFLRHCHGLSELDSRSSSTGISQVGIGSAAGRGEDGTSAGVGSVDTRLSDQHADVILIDTQTARRGAGRGRGSEQRGALTGCRQFPGQDRLQNARAFRPLRAPRRIAAKRKRGVQRVLRAVLACLSASFFPPTQIPPLTHTRSPNKHNESQPLLRA